jgi:hypothetical protein
MKQTRSRVGSCCFLFVAPSRDRSQPQMLTADRSRRFLSFRSLYSASASSPTSSSSCLLFISSTRFLDVSPDYRVRQSLAEVRETAEAHGRSGGASGRF